MIRVAPIHKRILKMPKLIRHCLEFTNHPSVSFIDRVRFTLNTIKIVMNDDTWPFGNQTNQRPKT